MNRTVAGAKFSKGLFKLGDGRWATLVIISFIAELYVQGVGVLEQEGTS